MNGTLKSRLEALAALTPSRVRLDFAGGPVPLDRLLSFQEDHAAARDAITERPDWPGLAAALDRPVQLVQSRAPDRASYLRRPDLGRRLARGTEVAESRPSLAIVIADGLSPPAVMAHAAPLVAALDGVCAASRGAPVFLAEQARVAIGDEIGALCGARLVLVLIGERPGLTVSDSLGAYLTWAPAPGTRDSARNCVSNIHARGGLSYTAAAARLAWLIAQAGERRVTGIGLKDESPNLISAKDRIPER
ncbi:ethanolamine ammonia-lyase subunit EutC [Celeribacter indicus]|uniref:Ethanolamine ammonia-lyase small subunit n=1 Tax=Celeribacter indicus TaxID=1208324 RepID=A0A0B5E3D3_9RHOB|nr:ethanolamine ammonia-lyase subunit EutC [Celeribacter indicus]AJE47561.1 Ethanolamine ammonia-lyase light chain [Celeribacter indicus]SDW10239.1 Ethanolamine ammonia-lyase light chain [Celeribacter indicus]